MVYAPMCCRNSASFPRRDIRLANPVQQGRLAVVNVAMIVTTGGRAPGPRLCPPHPARPRASGHATNPLPALALFHLEPEAVLGADLLRNGFRQWPGSRWQRRPTPFRSAMILNGFCFSWSASSRTTIGGLIVMTVALAGNTILGADAVSADLAKAETFFGIPCRLPGSAGAPGGLVTPRPPRRSPRLAKSALLISPGLAGSLALPVLSPSLEPAWSAT